MLVEKAVATVHTRVPTSLPKGGVHADLDVYRQLTGTSGVSLAAQARKLMGLDPAKKVEDIADRVDDWIPT